METLRTQVRIARTRLVIEQVMGRLVGCLFVALIVTAVAIAIPKLVAIQGLPHAWDVGCLLAGLVAAITGTLVWTLLSRRTELDAAMEIDRRFGLKERVASSLQLSEREFDSEVGTALVRDAVRRIERIEVNERFRVGINRRSWLPLVPAAVAFALMVFVEDRTAQSKAETDPTKVTEKKPVERAGKKLRKKLEEQRKKAEEQGLKDPDGLFKKLEKAAKELADKQLDKHKAAIKLNDVAKELEARRRKIGNEGNLKRQLDKLKKISRGPADRLADALSKGNFKSALEAIKKLQEDLKKGNLDKEAKQKLTQQLNEMKQKLQDAADAHKQAMEDLKRQIEKAQRQGNTSQAAQLQKQLDKLTQSMPQMDALRQLAQNLGQAQQCMNDGDAEGAANAMQKLAEDLEGMQQQLQEMQMLDQMLQQIADAKQAMACKQCQGTGCTMCQGGMFGKFAQKPGMGMGEGRGKGPRPDEENATSNRDSQVRAKPAPGRAVWAGEFNGPNVKGQVLESIKQELSADNREAADPLTSQRLPRNQREHVEDYFKSLNPGG